MGKFKEINDKVYVYEASSAASSMDSSNSQTHYFVQPTFVGLIELFKNLSVNLEFAKHPSGQADFLDENDQLERERPSLCTPEEFCSVV